MPKSRRHIIPATAEVLSLLFSILVVLVIGLLSYRAWDAFGRRSTQLEISQRILSGTAALLSSLKDAETGQRGFLLTDEDHYLEPYRQALTDVPRLLASVSEVTGTRRPDQAA